MVLIFRPGTRTVQLRVVAFVQVCKLETSNTNEASLKMRGDTNMANICMPNRCGMASGGSLLALSIAMVLTPKLATAQQPEGDQPAETVVVTGSRIARTGFDSAQPLSIVDAAQIEDLGIVNVGDAIRTLPQNTPFFTDTNVGIGNFNVGA
ncbi:MAG: hypothetical protein OEZ08_19010, partial [Betaproteobacteria bacterium]|nr:hypothetical protein [Betaproteobacteria bacterium]